MPYTPPAQKSPGASNPSSPALSRSQSYRSSQGDHPQSAVSNGPPGALPRSLSSSYLTMHRRSPSASRIPPSRAAAEQSTSIKPDAMAEVRFDPHYSVRQSPPPVNDSTMPSGAVMSPPESSHSSSDDEYISGDRGRELENLAELEAAIRTIEQGKKTSPDRTVGNTKKVRAPLDIVIPRHSAYAPSQTASSISQRPPLSKEARKISHSRSSTESSLVLDVAQPPPSSQVMVPCIRSESDEDEDESEATGRRSRPQMLRKKSGELVRPALRPASCTRRPSSMPGTPTYSKAVHFDAHLEHVRHFLQVDKPLAVSAGSSPVDSYQSEIEFPFGVDESRQSRSSLPEYQIQLPNFPPETPERKDLLVRVDRVCLSSDNQNLVGTVAVRNMSFRKQVTARFTLDYWKTTSEVTAEYNNDVRRKFVNDGYDRFNFFIKLADQANLERKTMYFCVRYDVDGQQYWDNNGSINYQVDFAKKAQGYGINSMPGLGARPLNALPRSKPSPPMSAGAPRPKSMSHAFDDFASSFDSFGPIQQLPISMTGDSPIKLRGSRPQADFLPDAPARRSKGNGPAFGNRYDFGVSLSAAIQNASTLQSDQNGSARKRPTEEPSRQALFSDSVSVDSMQPKPMGAAANQSLERPEAAQAVASSAAKPVALHSSSPSLQSQSYQELVDKYCFFGSAKTSPLNPPRPDLVDGAKEGTDTLASGDRAVSETSSPTDSTESFTEVDELPLPTALPLSRTSSPTPKTGSGLGAANPSSPPFRYPFHQSLTKGFFDAQTATAIHG